MRPLRWLPLWLILGWSYALTIVVFCLIPLASPSMNFHWSDKLEHLSAYALLMGWFALILLDPTLLRRYALGFIAMGLGIECLQGLTDYRSFEWADWGADSLGVLLGLLPVRSNAAQALLRLESWLPAPAGNPPPP